MEKMQIEIWSDVLCPFCYIGKRQFEAALKDFTHANSVDIEWKSFQLDPYAPEDSTETQVEYLVKRKGMNPMQVQQMLDNVTAYAKEVGLDYDLENALTVNSMKAHKLIQYAKHMGLADEAEERLFRAFFTESKNIADVDTLLALGREIGLDEQKLKEALASDEVSYWVTQDIQEAQQVGVTGVPFFVFNRKYAISGAQPAEAFLATLEKSFDEWKKDSSSTLNIVEGSVCTPDGKCD